VRARCFPVPAIPRQQNDILSIELGSCHRLKHITVYDAMELAVPVQTFQIQHMRVGSLLRGQKLILPLSYEDDIASLPALSIILPLLPIYSYDPMTGNLVLTLNSTVAHGKLHALQDAVLQAIKNQHARWFPTYKEKTAEEIRAGFQSMVSGHHLHLYCPIGSGGNYDIHTFLEGVWSRGAKTTSLLPGTLVRVVLRIQGVAFHQHPITGAWTGKFRLQHRILGLYIAASPEHVTNSNDGNDTKGKSSTT